MCGVSVLITMNGVCSFWPPKRVGEQPALTADRAPWQETRCPTQAELSKGPNSVHTSFLTTSKHSGLLWWKTSVLTVPTMGIASSGVEAVVRMWKCLCGESDSWSLSVQETRTVLTASLGVACMSSKHYLSTSCQGGMQGTFSIWAESYSPIIIWLFPKYTIYMTKLENYILLSFLSLKIIVKENKMS